MKTTNNGDSVQRHVSPVWFWWKLSREEQLRAEIAREAKRRREDADDCDRLTIQLNLLAENGTIAGKVLTPKAVREDDCGRCVGAILLRCKVTTKGWRDA